MKKILFLLIFLPLIFGCATNKNAIEKNTDSFIYEYDDIKDVNYITHELMKVGYLYNLRDSLSGERENLRLYIANGKLLLSVNYQFKNWAFFDSVVFLGNNSRLQIKLDNRISNIVSGSVVREQYDTILNADTIQELNNLLSCDSVQVAFLGSYSTNKINIPVKYINAMQETINKYLLLNE